MGNRILLIEDEYAIASFVTQGLQESGYAVAVCYDGEKGLEMLQDGDFDLVILDIVLPGMDGREVARTIRGQGLDLPILMLTALGSTENVVRGLDSGADDYLVKPFKFKELEARVRALSRRRSSGPRGNRTLSAGNLVLDRDAKTVRRGEADIHLTATEYRLLEYLLLNKNRVLSRIDILESVWDITFNLGTNVVDVYVNYLRNKIDKPFDSKLIHTVIGMGYTLKDNEP
ncbi:MULTISPECIES: response regulator transcription factor [Robiginitalea]|uniref:Two-component system response regulator n=1 Tax=Robiginitalea biformata (strain ATCC BAA-864 / DSM 15991 / KCTC 12146 / HTCC2501) TaxID=313596 RepID=A4CPK1_ROBBH|nr:MULTISPECIES: response regulator transcription factor [Robiginitalea]EAR14322.1 two-component system response regulator [Robiginitalea biformata HTCC2501]MDC6354591.1 response regulator transcription factor [Robiginitalea sp. PM2]MDC6374727.1 response regulator transcription factor [Robiginitalea sp. SP8]